MTPCSRNFVCLETWCLCGCHFAISSAVYSCDLMMRMLLKERAVERFFRSRYALAFLAMIAAVFRGATFKNASLGGYDERLYLIFMVNFYSRGIEGIQNILHAFPSDPVLLQGPLPFRFLFIWAGTWVCRIFGGFTYANLAKLSLISGIGIVIVGYLLFRRWFSPAVAFLGGILLIFSPLVSGLSRRALQDPFFCLLVLCVFYFFDEVWRKPTIRNFILLGVFLLACFLTKETIVILYPVFLVLGWYYRRTINKECPILPFVLVFAIAPVLYLAVMWWIAGDLKTFYSTYSLYVSMQQKIPYAVSYQRGPWFRYLVDLLMISPLTYMFSVLSISNQEPSERNGRNLAALYALSIIIAFSCLVLLNLRTILFVDIPLRGLAAVGVFGLANRFLTQFSRGFWIVLISAFLVSSDLVQFFRLYMLGNLYDPTTFHLIQSNGMLH